MSQAVREFFDRKAEPWSQKYALAGPLAPRLLELSRTVPKLVKSPGPVLDLGCGTGDLAAMLFQKGYLVTGADISPEMIRVAQTRFGVGPHWVVLPPDWRELPFESGALACVVAASVLEYLSDPGPTIAEVARVLRRGGVFALTLPDPRHPIRRLEAALRLLLSPGVFRPLLGRSRAGRFREYLNLSVTRWPEAQLNRVMDQHGFEPVHVSAAGQPLRLYAFGRR